MAKGSIEDELALVKAAAWAWYQHGAGSGCDGRAVREFDSGGTSGKSTCRPSRYKLEAIGRRNTSNGTTTAAADEGEEDRSEAAVGLSPAHTDMSLLDSYEIESISLQLKRILASAAASSVGKQGGYLVVEAQAEEEGFGRRRQQRRRPPATSKKEKDAFWARHAIGFCTSRGDVVEAAVTASGGRRRRKSGSSVRLTADFQFHQP